MKENILISRVVFFFVLLSFAFISNANFVSSQACSIDNCSIDSALVYQNDNIVGGVLQGGIFYSFYGHNPKIPKPINQPLTYSWWTPTGNTTALIPGSTSGGMPSVAFERSTGNPAVAWTRGDNIYYSKWDGAAWSTPEIVHSSPNPSAFIIEWSPVIIIDVNDAVIVTWMEEEFQVSRKILSKYKTGAGWSTATTIRNLPVDPFSASFEFYDLEMAFTPKIVDSITKHDAYLVWQEDTGQTSITCPSGSVVASHYKAFYSYWNGNTWSPATQIDGQPNAPPYNTYRGLLDISSDKKGNITAVWSALESSNPCDINSYIGKVWTSTKPLGSPTWQNTQIIATGFNPSIAFTPEDVGIALYNSPIPPNNILYALKVNGTWTSVNNVYGSCGNNNGGAKIASMHKDKAMAVWQSSSGFTYNVCSQPMNTNTFTTQAQLPPTTGQSINLFYDIAAHTGSPQNPHAEWTYLLYQASDNDLDAAQENDRAEMKQVGSTNLVNAVALVDTLVTYPSTYIFYLYKYTERTVLDMGEQNSGDGKTLEDFMAFALEKYPSKRTVLDLSNHGIGWRGICIDDTSSKDLINYTELKNALTGVNNIFNLHVFSACLMGQLEIAHLIKTYGKYMVASEETMDGPGFPYNPILSNVTNDPFISDSKYASNYVEIFKDFYSGPAWSGADTLSAIDLSKIQQLTNSVNILATALLINSANYSDAIRNAKNMSQEFPHPTIFSYPKLGYRDLGHFAKLINETINNTGVKLAALDVISKVNDSVINNWAGPGHAPNATGLSIYLPLHKSDYDNDYNLTNFYTQTTWDEFITEQPAPDNRILIKLITNPIVSLFINSVGGAIGLPTLGNRKCSSSCGTTMSDTMCLQDQNGYTMAFPIVDSFNYLINGSALQNASNYTLNIKVIANDVLTYQESIIGTINPGQIISGQFYAPPTITLQGTPSLGSTINFQVTSPQSPNENYVLGLALGTSPGITLPDGRNVPLNPDFLFAISLDAQQAQAILNMTNNFGTLNQNGQAQVSMTIPNIPQAVGLTFYAAFATVNATGVHEISPAIPITVQP